VRAQGSATATGRRAASLRPEKGRQAGLWSRAGSGLDYGFWTLALNRPVSGAASLYYYGVK
jgi:hypothetical protein